MQSGKLRQNAAIWLVSVVQILALAYAVGYSEEAEARCRGSRCSTRGSGFFSRMFGGGCSGSGCRTQRTMVRQGGCRSCGQRQMCGSRGGCSSCSMRGGCSTCSTRGGCSTCPSRGGCSTCGSNGQGCSTCANGSCSTNGIHAGQVAVPFGGVNHVASRALASSAQGFSLQHGCNVPWQGQVAQMCLNNGKQQLAVLYDLGTGRLLVANGAGNPIPLPAEFANPILNDYRQAAGKPGVDPKIAFIAQQNPRDVQDPIAPPAPQGEPTPVQPGGPSAVAEQGAPQQQAQPQSSGGQLLSSGGVPVKYYGYNPNGTPASKQDAAKWMAQDAATLLQILRNPAGTNARILYSMTPCGGCSTLHNILSGKGGSVSVSDMNIAGQGDLAAKLGLGAGSQIYVVHVNSIGALAQAGQTELAQLLESNMPAEVPAVLGGGVPAVARR